MSNLVIKPLEQVSSCSFGSQRKCVDPVSLALGIGSLGAGVIGSIIGGNQSSANTAAANRSNLQIARETNATSTRIANNNNQMQYKMMQENNEFNRRSALEMFDLENQYNSPIQQVARLRAAGLNPANVLANGGAQVSGMSDASTPQASASGISPSMPSLVTPTMQPEPSSLGATIQNIGQLAGALSSIAGAKKSNAEAAATAKKLGAEIDKLLSEKNLNEAKTSYQNFIKGLEQDWLPKKYESQIANDFSQVYMNYLKGENEYADTQLKKLEEKINDWNWKKEQEMKPIIIQQMRESINLLKEQQSAARASARASDASANLSNAQARNWNILNNHLPWKLANDLTIQDLDVFDKVMNSGSAHNKYELIDQLVKGGMRREVAESIAENRDKYRNEFKK